MLYDKDGKETVHEDFALAVRTKDGICKIRYGKTRRWWGKMFDPDANDISELKSSDRTSGMPIWEFRIVPEAQFDNYIQFLRTRIVTYFRLANRTYS